MTVIDVADVTVRFRPFTDRRPTLRRALANRSLREPETVTALEGVSFSVEQGESFGVIGPNGAGKTTLLRVLARTLRPDEGTVRVLGKTSTLLQLGTGFKRELSGVQNIYLGGLAAGLRRSEIDEKFDQIVSFSGIGEAVHRPVNTYSSGMFSRLAFSIAMALEPQVLLLDEVLAVGDAEFREKSMHAMRELLASDGTIVFVSHSLPQVAEFCDRAAWLERGKVKLAGDAASIVDLYSASVGRSG